MKRTNEEWAVMWKIDPENKRGGRDKAMRGILENNKGAIHVTTYKIENSYLEKDDFKQFIHMLIIKALDTFDLNRGSSFFSHLCWSLRASINLYRPTISLIRYPIGTKKTKNDDGSVSAKVVIKKCETISLDAPVSKAEHKESRMSCFKAKKDTDEFKDDSMKKHVEVLLPLIHGNERKFVDLYYGITSGEHLNLREIGEIYGMTRERARQVKEEGMKKLKQICRARSLLSNNVFLEMRNEYLVEEETSYLHDNGFREKFLTKVG